MRNNATNIKREAKMLEESKAIEMIEENKNSFYKFVRIKTKGLERFINKTGLLQNVIKKR